MWTSIIGEAIQDLKGTEKWRLIGWLRWRSPIGIDGV